MEVDLRLWWQLRRSWREITAVLVITMLFATVLVINGVWGMLK